MEQEGNAQESSGLTADENNLLHSMWKKVQLDEEFC